MDPEALERMFCAVRRSLPDEAEALLAAGLDPDSTYSDNALLSLCMPNNSAEAHATLHALLAAGADPDGASAGGERPIFGWAASGYGGAVEALLARGASADGRSQRAGGKGQTLLLAASEGGLEGIVQRQLDAGADLAARCDRGLGALHLAVDALRWRHDPPKDPLGVTARLIRAGVDLDLEAPEDVGTPLHRAARRGTRGVIDALLEAGADPLRVTDESGASTLHHAALGGDLDILDRLLEAGVDPDAQDRFGWTALHFAAHRKAEPLVRRLLEVGADPSRSSGAARDVEGRRYGPRKRPVDVARRGRQKDLVALLGP